jgi:hypothetical protein
MNTDFFLDDKVLPTDSIPSQTQQPIEAIMNTLRSVFGSSLETTATSTKRTLLKRIDGQIVTEKHVIDQMEEKQKKENEKQAKKKSNATKRRRTEKNGE